MNIVKPSVEQVHEYLEDFDKKERYALPEPSLRKLFKHTYRQNTDFNEVLVKVCTLNSLYSTNIRLPVIVAKHIVSLNIDQRLEDRELSLVNDIARVQYDQRTIKHYSFATKYCSHHCPEYFPIYDSFVIKMLKHFRKEDKFCKFTNDCLEDYPTFYGIVDQFRKHYGLEKFSFKDVDRYLWQAGKEHFPNKPSKSKSK